MFPLIPKLNNKLVAEQVHNIMSVSRVVGLHLREPYGIVRCCCGAAMGCVSNVD